MCGFGGIVNSSTPVGKDRLSEIARCVVHRGPDSTGLDLFDKNFHPVESDASHAFFFNRLAVIDLAVRANQPFEDENYFLQFNGEIYNFKDIREELKRAGDVFTTTSDTEVLFRSLNRWGRAAIEKLNGMFSFFWLNKKERTFIIARDRIGIKPLYYRQEGKQLIFASELHSVVRFSKSDVSISSQAVTSYLSLQYVPTPGTILNDVFKLPPGHFLEGSVDKLEAGQKIKPVAFWNAYSPGIYNRETDLEKILTQSVKGQLEADVPLGLFLSSGVDSSLLTAIINKHFAGRPYDFFTVAFDQDTASDESKSASDYINGFKNPDLRHHILTLNSEFISSRLNSLYKYYDEPFGDSAALLNWAISQKAREHVTVALSGDGADELFWGYPRYDQWRREYSRAYKGIPMLGAVKGILKQLPDSREKYTLMNMMEADPIRVHFNILRPRMFGFLPNVESNKALWCMDGLEKIRNREDLPAIIDLKAYLADAMLYKVDRASMASSLEVRVPYLDNSVIDYALSLPFSEKSNTEFNNKAPLKKLLGRLAPHYDLHKSKKGFSFPLETWMRGTWSDLIRESITKSSLSDLGLPDKPYLDIVGAFYDKGAHYTNEVWYLFNLTLWHKAFKSNFQKRVSSVEGK